MYEKYDELKSISRGLSHVTGFTKWMSSIVMNQIFVSFTIPKAGQGRFFIGYMTKVTQG